MTLFFIIKNVIINFVPSFLSFIQISNATFLVVLFTCYQYSNYSYFRNIIDSFLLLTKGFIIIYLHCFNFLIDFNNATTGDFIKIIFH